MAVQNKLYTVEEFEAFVREPDNRDRLFELVNGEIVEKMVTFEHSVIALAFGAKLYNYLEQNPIGRAGVEGAFRPTEDRRNVRLPDISIVLGLDKPVTRVGSTPYMPDIAVEIQSPTDSPKDMRDKADFYLASGVRAVVLVYTPKRIVEVLTPDSRDLLNADDTLTLDLLPDFALPIAALFQNV